MRYKSRIEKLIASLQAKKKFSFWLEEAKATSGWESYWLKELSGPLVPFDWLADEEAHFLFLLVNDVNRDKRGQFMEALHRVCPELDTTN